MTNAEFGEFVSATAHRTDAEIFGFACTASLAQHCIDGIHQRARFAGKWHGLPLENTPCVRRGWCSWSFVFVGNITDEAECSFFGRLSIFASQTNGARQLVQWMHAVLPGGARR